MTPGDCRHRWRRTGTELTSTDTIRLWDCRLCGDTRETSVPRVGNFPTLLDLNYYRTYPEEPYE